MGETNKTKSLNSSGSSYTEFFYKAFRNILLVSVPLVVVSALILGFVPHSSAEVSGSTDNVSLTLSTSCTVNAVVTIAHETSLHGGQKDDNVGNTKLSAYCNDNNGYSVYAVGSSGDIDGNTDLINTVNESYNIRTGVYNDTIQTSPSSWAMKLTAGTGTGIDPVTGESVPTTPPTIINGYDNYSTIPNVYTQVAKRTSGTSMITDSDASGSYLNTTYQIYANSYQPAGTYNGKVKYVIVHPNSNNNNLSFNEAYALQGKNPVDTESGTYYTMQDITTDICNQVGLYGEASQTQLVDTRDNNLYWIAKLEDGHCWMTQNLDFDIDSTRTYTSYDTDLGYAGSQSTWMPSSSTISFVGETVPGWSSSYAPYSADPGDIYYYTSNSTSDDIKYTSLSACISAGHTEGECKHYHTGNYYNWAATMATNNTGDLVKSGTDIATSVCPAGWRLPSVNNNEFGISLAQYGVIDNQSSTTYTANGFNIVRQLPLYYVRSGGVEYDSNRIANVGISANYRSSTVPSGCYMTNFNFSASSVAPASCNIYNAARRAGSPIRCLAR